MIVTQIVTRPLNSGAELAPLLKLPGGAVASFTGLVREDQGVTTIELEHYPAMTEKALGWLAQTAMQRWPLLGCCIIHRIGKMEVGEEIVLTAASAPRRADAFDACRFLIDRLKTDIPLWKKEHFVDGSSRWVDAKASDADRAAGWD